VKRKPDQGLEGLSSGNQSLALVSEFQIRSSDSLEGHRRSIVSANGVDLECIIFVIVIELDKSDLLC